MDRVWVGAGSLAGLGAVGMAALGAHALPGRLDAASLHLVDVAVQIAAWHALALLFCGLWARRAGMAAHVAGGLFLLGTVLFCGALLTIALTAAGTGPAAPAGGLCLMGGWVALAVSALRRS